MIRVGEVEIARVEESVLDEATSLFSQWNDDTTRQHQGWMAPSFYNAERKVFRSVIQAWVLRTPERTILIDTCGGNDKDRPLSPRFHKLAIPFLDRLKVVGVEPDTVDMVILTHLHVDHVGWNTRLVGDTWVPMFPNAQYVASAVELETRDPARGGASRPPATWTIYRDSVEPVIDAGLMRVVEGHETLLPGVGLVPIPGHAPGQMGVQVRSGGREAFFIADAMHNPVQVHHPDWSSKYCEDPALANETRAKVLRHAADAGALILPGHFGAPHCGYVRRSGSGYVFEPSAVVP